MVSILLWCFLINSEPGNSSSNDAPETSHFFYKHYDYGADSVFNPVTVMINAGYEMIHLDPESPKNILHIDYKTGFQNVFKNFISPIKPINRQGWWNFTKRELLPLTWGNGAAWTANYMIHLIGGGATARGLAEWYATHDFPAPWIMSFINFQVYQWMNEVVENGSQKGDSTDEIADLWLFNNVGFFLFLNDDVSRFFSETLHLADWSPQGMFNLRDATLEGNSQRWTMKLFLPWSDRIGLFYHFGTAGLFGLTFRLDSTDSVSIGGGIRAKKVLVSEKTKTNLRSVSLGLTGGLFWDRNNTPLMSIVASPFGDDIGNFNVYPGLLRIGSFSFGSMIGLKSKGRFYAGISTIYTPGIGLSNFKAKR